MSFSWIQTQNVWNPKKLLDALLEFTSLLLRTYLSDVDMVVQQSLVDYTIQQSSCHCPQDIVLRVVQSFMGLVKAPQIFPKHRFINGFFIFISNMTERDERVNLVISV